MARPSYKAEKPRQATIACEIGNGGKRHLVIRAGKSHKFTIPAEEVPHRPAIPAMGTPKMRIT